MIRYCNIFWRPDFGVDAAPEGMMFANVHLAFGYDTPTIPAFQEMAEFMRQTFPDVQDCDLVCRVVTESTYCKGYPLMIYSGYIPKKTYPGFREKTWFDGKGYPDYSY
jgi:hypothetical protein